MLLKARPGPNLSLGDLIVRVEPLNDARCRITLPKSGIARTDVAAKCGKVIPRGFQRTNERRHLNRRSRRLITGPGCALLLHQATHSPQCTRPPLGASIVIPAEAGIQKRWISREQRPLHSLISATAGMMVIGASRHASRRPQVDERHAPTVPSSRRLFRQQSGSQATRRQRPAQKAGEGPSPLAARDQMWIGLPCTAIAASFTASECVGCAWQV